MGQYDILANANDGFLRSHAADYNDARAGTGTAVIDVSTSGNELDAGQWYDVGQNWLTEAFQEWTYTVPPSTDIVTTACYRIHGLMHVPTGDPWTLECREKDWGGTITSGDWTPGATTDDLPLLAQFPGIRSQRPMPFVWRSGSSVLRARLSNGTTSPLRTQLSSNKLWLGYTPDGNHNEWVGVGSFEYADGPYRPRIDYATTTKSTLTYVGGASVQLSDGSMVYLDSDGATTPVITLKHSTTGGTVTTISTLEFGLELYQFKLTPGAQAFAITRDASDNIFVLGPAGSEVSGVCLKAYAKGSGYNWSAKTAISTALPDYDEPINNFALTWHNVGTGRLVAVCGRTQGSSMLNQTFLVSLSAQNALNGTNSPVVTTAAFPTETGFSVINTSGNGLDILAVSGGRGYVAAIAGDHDFGEQSPKFKLYSYNVNSAGLITSSPSEITQISSIGAMDGNSKMRLIPISSTRFAAVGGGIVASFTYDGISITSLVGYASIASIGLASLSSAAVQPRDALYDSATNKIWIYYLDTANSRRLMRTSFALATSKMTGDEIQTATNLGASGSTHTAIRIPRSTVDERSVIIHLGNRTGGGALSTVLVTDTTLNQVPNAPVLNNPGSFTATSPKTFTWTFSDPNIKDRQSAFQLQIRNASTLVSALDTGKVTSTTAAYILAASTLSNSTSYEWRVRTYDTADQVGAYSNYQPFSTVTTGIAAITSPASDNLAGLVSPTLTITWTFTITAPATQAEYRVKVIRTDTGATVFNSGFIASPVATSYTVQGLISGVEQRVELVVQDSNGSLSNTATRLVTPSFSSPDAPTILAQPNESETEGSGILITVVNPDPTGALPPAGRNDVYRALTGSTDFIKIGEALVNGSFTDYTAAANVEYDYKVYAVADGQTSSAVVGPVSIEFLGVYVHKASDPDSTLMHYIYGSTSNADTIESKGTELRFVGRSYPVFEFGDALGESVAVDITIPFSDTHTSEVEYLREVVRSKATHCYRDSRGRKVFGVVRQVTPKNSGNVGTTVSFNLERVDYIEERP